MKAKLYTLLTACILFAATSFAYIDTVRTGSFLINMGVTPQTVNNGLKPYGLVYELMNSYKVPVWWIINTAKGKDGADFVHNGVTYRGGTFVVPAAYRTAAVNTAIANWQAQGVVGATAVNDFLAPVYMVLKYTPRWTMDSLNGHIATQFFINAGIPASAHGGSDKANWKTPAQLGACDDIFVLPHADPTWATHQNLYYWNQTYKGNIWASCHAPSVLENTKSPDNSIQMNFLTTNGMVPHKSKTRNISAPFVYDGHGEPMMQFVGLLDGAMTNGSEQAYLPSLTSAWRPSTTVAVADPDHPDIPTMSNGAAAIVAFGRAYGDTARGYVMYEAGHDITSDGTVAEQVAAQRAFFNYSFFIMTKTYDFEVTMSSVPPLALVNEPISLSFTVPSHIDLNQYTIKWTSTAPGVFSPNDYSQNVTFTPSGPAGQNAVITVTVSDACSREYISASSTYITGVLADADVKLAGVLKNDAAELSWTVDAKNISHCELEKQVNNSFQPIAMIFTEEGSGNKLYRYSDKQLTDAVNYYRLKVYAKSGSFTYTNIVRISGNKSTTPVTLLGNPVRTSVKLEYVVTKSEKVTMRMIDLQGRMLKIQNVIAGDNRILTMDLPANTSKGQYVVQLITSTETHSFKILVQ